LERGKRETLPLTRETTVIGCWI